MMMIWSSFAIQCFIILFSCYGCSGCLLFFGWSSSVIWWKWNKTSKYFNHIMYIHITSHHFFFSHNTLFINAICQLFRVIAEAASQLHFAELRKIVIVFHMHYLWMLSSHFFEAKTMNGFRYILFFMYSWAKKLQKQRALAFLILKLCGFLPHWHKNWTV